MSDATHFVQHIQRVVHNIKNHFKRAQDYQKRYFDKYYRLQEYLVGEEVLLSLKTLYLAGSGKLRARYVGPFRVIKRIGRTS